MALGVVKVRALARGARCGVLGELAMDRREAARRRDSARRQREIVRNGLLKGHLKVLNEDLILGSGHNSEIEEEDLQRVLRINLSCEHVQILQRKALLHCTNLTICNLTGCYVTKIAAFEGCCNLIKLDCADNQVLCDLLYE